MSTVEIITTVLDFVVYCVAIFLLVTVIGRVRKLERLVQLHAEFLALHSQRLNISSRRHESHLKMDAQLMRLIAMVGAANGITLDTSPLDDLIDDTDDDDDEEDNTDDTNYDGP